MPKMKNLFKEDSKIMAHIKRGNHCKDPNAKFESDYRQWQFGTHMMLVKNGFLKHNGKPFNNVWCGE